MNKRIKKCFHLINKAGLDGLLIHSPVDISYLTGFRLAEGGRLLLTGENVVYFTGFIFAQEAVRLSGWRVVQGREKFFPELLRIIRKNKLKKLGVDLNCLNLLRYREMERGLAGKAAIVCASGLVGEMRIIKDRAEITAIKKAAGITSQGFEFIRELTANKKFSEKDLCMETEKFLKLKGDNDVAFPPVIAFDKNTCFPHHTPGREVLTGKNLLLADIGCKYKGYCADLTRVFFLGKISPYLKKIRQVIIKAQDLAIKKIRAGVKAKNIDKAARQFIENKGLGKYFGHGLGHGVGMCVHERPLLNPSSEEILRENSVLTVEPAVYIPHKFGIRLERMVIVKKNKAEVIDVGFNW